MKAGKARGMQLIFAKFDSMRSLWASVTQATAMLDALGALAEASMRAGYCRPTIVECPTDGSPSINVQQGRHPCVDFTHSGGEFIPNDLALGGNVGESRMLLLRYVLIYICGMLHNNHTQCNLTANIYPIQCILFLYVIIVVQTWVGKARFCGRLA